MRKVVSYGKRFKIPSLILPNARSFVRIAKPFNAAIAKSPSVIYRMIPARIAANFLKIITLKSQQTQVKSVFSIRIFKRSYISV